MCLLYLILSYYIILYNIILSSYIIHSIIIGVKLITLNEFKKSSKIFDNDDINSYSAFILLSPCQESHYTDAIKLSNKYNNIPIIALNSPYSYRYDIGMIHNNHHHHHRQHHHHQYYHHHCHHHCNHHHHHICIYHHNHHPTHNNHHTNHSY